MTTAARYTASSSAIPELQNGDRLTRDEFARRYAGMERLKKAELIEGVVFSPAPVRIHQHGEPESMLSGWLSHFWAAHAELQLGANSTVRFDIDNEFQPDLLLRVRQGGSSSEGADGFIYGPPELVVEVSASSVSIDLHSKKNVYRRSGVSEYIVWRTEDGEVDWFRLEHGEYVSITPRHDGRLESLRFPGLVLDVPALLRGDLAAVLQAL